MSNVTRMLLGGVRHFTKRYKGEGGVKYGLITYYPRTPDHVDPPIEPTKLLMIQRVKPFKGNPYWQKNVLTLLNLHERSSAIAIVKNTPEMNSMLWEVKHLIKVTPIKCPNGLPKDGDLNGTYLHENGTFMVTHKVAIDPSRIEATEKFTNDWRRLDKETVQRQLRLKWLNPL
ncbi:39S ribosomal protein L30, mitochondrial [Athalia rosae]|uniref:39S ribosomal protein L30, mitochondrial n=1 Tax=Athalia rosae TaxID=37344 RepID=UPI0006255C47|nr:39S ribosomal protein L30, mitochondrial [Athalia rosae]